MPRPSGSEEGGRIRDALRRAEGLLRSHGADTPRLDAELLLSHCLKRDRAGLLLMGSEPLSRETAALFEGLLERRCRREPVAYILGEWGFCGLTLTVGPEVLIPRPETEFLVEAALALPEAASPRRVLELGTGSGAVILAYSAGRPRDRCLASDRSPAALRVARGNALRNGLEARVDFLCGDWLEALRPGPRIDLILSNPPYVPSGDIESLSPEIARYEPRGALDGGPDGLSALFRIADAAPRHLRAGGSLILEIGCDQAGALKRRLESAGCFREVRLIRDFAGLDRVAAAVFTGEGA